MDRDDQQKNGNESKTIEFQFDFDVLFDEMTIEEYIGVQRVIPELCYKFFSRYVSDGDGGVLPPLTGMIQVKQMSVNDFYNAAVELTKKIREHGVNPTRPTGS